MFLKFLELLKNHNQESYISEDDEEKVDKERKIRCKQLALDRLSKYLEQNASVITESYRALKRITEEIYAIETIKLLIQR